MGTTMSPKRNPESYLEAANAEERKARHGRLKIYLGASPGVGKTYQMLNDALSLRAQGLDVVIGVIETHGREEVESLASAFERVPMLSVLMENYTAYALDVVGVIKRSPGLVLIDEAAFRNPDGLRHPKRWQDILELIERGIDVCTTLNVQHLESLNDVISHLIGVPIYETVPDAFIERATYIELIDLPSEDLIARLKQGKIYVPQEIAMAEHHFFKKKNLDALRELALKTVEERVSSEVENEYSKTFSARLMYKEITLLVCINGDESMPKLIRAAKRLSVRLKCPWHALFVDTGDKKQFFSAENHLKLADSLGAKTHVIFSTHVVKAIEEFSEQHQVTQMILGRGKQQWWQPFSINQQLKYHLSDIGIYDIELHQRENKKSWRERLSLNVHFFMAMLMILVGVWGLHYFDTTVSPWVLGAVVTFLSLIISRMLKWTQLIILMGLFVGIELLVNPIVLDLLLDNWKIWLSYYGSWSLLFLTLSIYLIYAKKRLQMTHEIERNNGFLVGFYQEISGVRGVDDILKRAYHFLSAFFGCDIKVYGKRQQNFHQLMHSDPAAQVDEKELAIAQWVYESRQPAGKGTNNLSYSQSYFFPLSGAHRCLGVMQFYAQEGFNLTPVQKKLLMVCLQQLTNILEIEQQQLEETLRDRKHVKMQLGEELLQRFSKQLYQPLGEILENLPTEWNHHSNAKTLTRLKNHLQIIAYFSDKKLMKQKSLQNIQQVIQDVIRHMMAWEKRPVEWHVAANIPEVEVHLDLVKAVMVEILDNILDHDSAKKGIEVAIFVKENFLHVSIADFGPGLSKQELSKIFETFYQVPQYARQDGLGLGLALCERIITWHGGKIWAENRKPQGAIFNFTLPLKKS